MEVGRDTNSSSNHFFGGSMGGGEGDWLDTAVDPEAIQGGEKPIIEAEQTSYFWVCLKQIKPVRRATLKPFSDDF